MDCDKVLDDLHLYISKKLDDSISREIEEHIDNCSSCKKQLKEVSWFFLSLEQDPPPGISHDFSQRVLKRTKSLPVKEKPWLLRFKKSIQVPAVKWPLEGFAAVAVVMLITFTFYRGIFTDHPSRPDSGLKGTKITLYDVRNPVLIVSDKPSDIALDDLKQLVKNRQGKILQVLMRADGFRITIGIPTEREKIMLSEFNKLGKVTRSQEGYKDNKGNIVVLLLTKNK
jgi:hypothetical protein